MRFSSAAVLASLLGCGRGAQSGLPAEMVYATAQPGETRLYAIAETRAERLVFEVKPADRPSPGLFIADPGGQTRGLTGAGSSATLSAALE